MPQQPGVPLAVALVVLVAIASAVSRLGRLRMGRPVATTPVRAVIQLAAVA